MKTFLIELDNRPDGETNSSIVGYSTTPIALAEFYKRCGVAVATTLFTSVVLEVCTAEGKVIDRKIIQTQYVPPEPEPPEPEDEESGDGE